MAYKEKIITVMDDDKERTFKIKKFNALTGSFILYNLLNKVLPAFLSTELNTAVADAPNADLLTQDKMVGIAQTLNKVEMTRDEFMQLQRDCLSVCYEVLPGREVPVVDPTTGNFGAIGLEDNTGVVMNLTIQSLIFNVKGFLQTAAWLRR